MLQVIFQNIEQQRPERIRVKLNLFMVYKANRDISTPL
ncbi:hypothetical protein JCM19232_4022 [Vibrio ishigakensis]|uniref:Uncharacterized protein n=1 Tax=Vibrio ishigakensis TaxID=1481914 RepID=A0A0B8P2S9_9VIBR|nr:hypothetical protein JCM19232_4022 [Vibrio ishigakensis]